MSADKEIAELRRDAERYRWLRKRGNDPLLVNQWWDDHKIISLGYGDYEHLIEDELDAAIDAAMKGEKRPPCT